MNALVIRSYQLLADAQGVILVGQLPGSVYTSRIEEEVVRPERSRHSSEVYEATRGRYFHEEIF